MRDSQEEHHYFFLPLDPLYKIIEFTIENQKRILLELEEKTKSIKTRFVERWEHNIKQYHEKLKHSESEAPASSLVDFMSLARDFGLNLKMGNNSLDNYSEGQPNESIEQREKREFIVKRNIIDGFLFQHDNKEILAENTITGDKYIGFFNLQGKYHGKGEIWYHDGSYYLGEFENGKKHGAGLFIDSSGKMFQGQFQHDKRYYGKFYWKDGRSYEGYYENDMKSGIGVHTWSTPYLAKFIGNFKNNERFGHGLYFFHDYHFFCGNYFQDKRHGKGILFYPTCKELSAEQRSQKRKFTIGHYHLGNPANAFFSVKQDGTPFVCYFESNGILQQEYIWTMPELFQNLLQCHLCDVEMVFL